MIKNVNYISTENEKNDFQYKRKKYDSFYKKKKS